jgi:hypothetical protein
MAMLAHRRWTREEIMVGSGCGRRFRVGSRSRERERRGANAWRNSWNLPMPNIVGFCVFFFTMALQIPRPFQVDPRVN